MIWFDYFDKIYCINLLKRTDRKERVTAEFNSVGILPKIIWFDAIERADGNTGCCLSHIYSWISLKNNCLCFEDDVTFHEKTKPILNRSVEQLINEDWDIYYLGYNAGYQCNIKSYKPYLAKVVGVWTTHAIAYSLSGVKKLLEKLYLFNCCPETSKLLSRKSPYAKYLKNRFIPIDMLIRTMTETGELNCFACDPLVVGQYNSVSDLTKKMTKFESWWDKPEKYMI